jgi:hypothetical protein
MLFIIFYRLKIIKLPLKLLWGKNKLEWIVENLNAILTELKDVLKATFSNSNLLKGRICSFSTSGVPNLGDASPWGDASGSISMISWVHLYQWGDAIDVRGDAEAKRLGSPALRYVKQSDWFLMKFITYEIFKKIIYFFVFNVISNINFQTKSSLWKCPFNSFKFLNF